ncbi:MAG: hypothetical protein ABJP34_11040 [Erythrobacter sp.]
MKLSRRTVLSGGALGLAGASLTLAGCGGRTAKSGTTKVTVLGTSHSKHRTSTRYSLDILREAVRRAEPDIILTEIPPDRIAEAKRGFAETGEVTEPRTRVFPEYTDVIFPLSKEMPFEFVGTAGWTQEIADNRQAALKKINEDPARADQWAEHLAARRTYSREIAGRGDDPLFMHTDAFDKLVERAQAPYQRYFDADLGTGGWTQINEAHTGLIGAALDTISGQGLNVLITFGSWHKYMIKRALLQRDDVELIDPKRLFV